MRLLCPRCQRANPGEALYCHFDGFVLRQGAVPDTSVLAQLPLEFVFPSGRRCRSYDDLVQGCQYDWEDARDLLGRGVFEGYLARVGRHDLARVAKDARTEKDPDIALHNFVKGLPVTQAQGPRLDLNPRRVQITPLPAGSQRELTVTVTNLGKGLLQGKLTVQDGGSWLTHKGGDPVRQPLKTAREQEVALCVDARGLAPACYHARLTVITNGGVAEVPIRIDVTPSPFPSVPYHGATSPRDLAERMRNNPKPAVPLLEAGEVARWFAANGWAYPVAGSTARGVAAVQQFFEGMGLSKPPELSLSATTINIRPAPNAPASGQVVLRTEARKWVYAQVDSDRAWLRVTTPSVSGPRQALIAFEAVTSVLESDRTHEATVRIVANAGQKLAVRVEVEVALPTGSVTHRLFRPALAGLLIGFAYRLLLEIPAYLAVRFPFHKSTRESEFGLTDPAALRSFILLTWWVGALVFVTGVRKKGGSRSDLFFGAVAGAAAGVGGAATAACLMDAGDSVPRMLLEGMRDVPFLLQCLVSIVCWGLYGAAVCFALSRFGTLGRKTLSAIAKPLLFLTRIGRLRPLEGILRLPY